MRNTRKLLLEHFDEDVHERLKVNVVGAQEKLDRIGRLFWSVTKHELGGSAEFHDNTFTFTLQCSPIVDATTGRYCLISKTQNNMPSAHLYRLSHPLGEHVLTKAKSRPCAPAEIMFDITNHPTRIAVIERLKGKAGWLSLQHVRVDSFDFEEYLLFSAIDDEGNNIDQETCEKLFNCAGVSNGEITVAEDAQRRLRADEERHAQATIARNLEENSRHFAEARDQLDKWADDMEMAAQRELDDTKRMIRELQRQSRQAPTLQDQHQIQEEITKLERKKRMLRERIFDIEDEIAAKRDTLVAALEKRMQQKTTVTPLFTIRWSVH